jgi:hypothetical protein
VPKSDIRYDRLEDLWLVQTADHSGDHRQQPRTLTIEIASEEQPRLRRNLEQTLIKQHGKPSADGPQLVERPPNESEIIPTHAWFLPFMLRLFGAKALDGSSHHHVHLHFRRAGIP